MKKVIFMLLLSAVTLAPVFGQKDSTNTDQIKGKISETERIIDKYGGKIIEGFNKVVKEVTPYAEEGFRVVVRLEIAKGIYYMVPTLIFLIMCIIFYRKGIFSWMFKEKAWDTPMPLFTGMVLVCIGAWAALNFPDGILHLMAPEWFAIKELIDLVK